MKFPAVVIDSPLLYTYATERVEFLNREKFILLD